MPITLSESNNVQDFNNPGFGPETVFAAGGDDFLTSNTLGGSFFLGQTGNDTLVALGPSDSMFGGKDEDSLRGKVDRVYLSGNDGSDVIIAEGSDSTLYGGKGQDTLQGLNARNRLSADKDDDFVLGGIQGNDSLFGGGGNDTIGFTTAGGGNNTAVNNGSASTVGSNQGGNLVYADGAINDQNVLTEDVEDGGNDYIYGVGNRDRLYGGRGNDSIRGRGSNSYFDGGTGNDTIDHLNYTTTSFLGIPEQVLVDRSTLWGGEGDDCLLGGYSGFDRGQNSIAGGAGNDTIEGYAARDILSGGDGNDQIKTVADTVFINGGGYTTLPGWAGRNTLDGGAGNDTLTAAFISDTMVGGTGNDSLSGVFNRATGDDGNDTIDARSMTFGSSPGQIPAGTIPGNIQINLVGGLGDDVLWGNTSPSASNVFDGSAGNDTMYFGNAYDKITGVYDGNDWLDLTRLPAGTTPISISDFSGNNVFVGGNTIAVPLYLTAGTGADNILGGASNDWLVGGQGNDSLFGLDGDDTLNSGGVGSSSLFGGRGRDCLIGGSGSDSYYFNSVADASGNGTAADFITSFVSSFSSGGVNADKFILSATNFSFPTTGVLSDPNRFVEIAGTSVYVDSATAGTPNSASINGPVVIYERPGGANGGTVKYDPDGRGAQPAITLAVLAPISGETPFLQRVDFTII